MTVPAAPRRRLPRWTRRIAILLCLVAGWLAWVVLSDRIVVSPETTFITAPLGADGLPDYERYWAEQQSAGVTRENNAAVLLFQVTPPELIQNDSTRKAIYHYLRMEPSPEATIPWDLKPYFAGRNLDRTGWLTVQLEMNYGSEPVTAERFPELQKWLDDHATRIDLVADASRRERLYCGLPLGPPSFTGPPYTDLVHMVDVWINPLRLRSRMKQGTGDLEGAWDDALAAMRLAHLMAAPARFDEVSAYEALIQVPYDAKYPPAPPALILLDPRLSLEQVRRFRGQLRDLPPIITMETGLEWERLKWHNLLVHPDSPTIPPDVPRPSWDVNPNRLMRNVNRWHDELFRIHRTESGRERLKTYFNLVGTQPDGVSALSAYLAKLRNLFRKRRQSQGNVFDEVQCFQRCYANALALSFQSSHDRISVFQQLTDIGGAVAEYRARTGALPATLDELVGSEWDAVPIDPWSGQPIGYVVRDGKFAVFSVSFDGVAYTGQPGQDRDEIVFGDLHLTPPEAVP